MLRAVAGARVDALESLINSLFGVGEPGAIYVFRPNVQGVQALFQNSSSTTPVTADGDPIGSTKDQSPNSRSAIQSVSAARPVYNTDEALNFAAFDGIDDFLLATYGAAVTPPCTLSIAMNRLNTTNAVVLLAGLNLATRHQISISSGGSLVGICGGSVLSGSNLPVGKHIITLVINGANSSLRVDGVIVASGTLNNSIAATGLAISAVDSGSNPMRQDVYGIVHAEGVDKVDDIESYLSGLAGITR
jgi:hypothetical protein